MLYTSATGYTDRTKWRPIRLAVRVDIVLPEETPCPLSRQVLVQHRQILYHYLPEENPSDILIRIMQWESSHVELPCGEQSGVEED
jgi:hypothetical protein